MLRIYLLISLDKQTLSKFKQISQSRNISPLALFSEIVSKYEKLFNSNLSLNFTSYLSHVYYNFSDYQKFYLHISNDDHDKIKEFSFTHNIHINWVISSLINIFTNNDDIDNNTLKKFSPLEKNKITSVYIKIDHSYKLLFFKQAKALHKKTRILFLLAFEDFLKIINKSKKYKFKYPQSFSQNKSIMYIVSLRDEDYSKIKNAAKKLNTSISQVCSEAIVRYLKKHKLTD